MTRYPLTIPEEKILRAMGRYHYLTELQVRRLLFSRGSRTYVAEALAKLTERKVLHMERDGSRGIWSLTGTGRRILEELGMSLLPRVRHKRERTGRFWDHILSVNDAMITIELYTRENRGVELAGMLHERAFHRGPERVELILSGKRISNPVAADGWVDLRIGGYQSCLWLEVDRDTEHIKEWIRKISSIIEYHSSGRYEERFGTDSLTVLVIAVPKTGKAAHRRMQELLTWTEDTLKHLGKEAWGEVFRFTEVNPEFVWAKPTEGSGGISPAQYFHSRYWLKPFDHLPLPLFDFEEAA
jgi:hypothetical protein